MRWRASNLKKMTRAVGNAWCGCDIWCLIERRIKELMIDGKGSDAAMIMAYSVGHSGSVA